MISAVWGGVDRPINQPYGPTTLSVEPLYKGQHWHCGVDVDMNTGTPLYAARPGRVTEITYGILALQALGRTESDYYVHIDRAVVAMGQTVAAGVLIAYSGNKAPSGGVTFGPHLHFEVNTAALNTPPAIDPAAVLSGLYGSGSGTLGDTDMTPEQDAKLTDIQLDIQNLYYALGLAVPRPADASKAQSDVLAAVRAEIAALKASGGSTVAPVALKLGGSFTGSLVAE